MTQIDFLQELEQDAPPPRRGLSLGSIVLLIGVALTVLVFGIALVRVQQGRPTSGPAPDFSLTTLDGKPFTLSEQKGKVVVINFWASWCGPCRTEAPALESLWQQYQGKDVTFLGITYADDPKDSQAFMAEFGMTYPVAEDGKSSVSKQLYHIQGVPETFVIDKQGNINRFFYFLTDDPSASTDDLQVNQAELGQIIDKLLASMSIPGLLFALLLALFVLAWIVMPLLQRPKQAEDNPLLEKQRERLLVYYERVLRNIHDLDEDYALGKMDEGEYGREREEWAQRGVQVLQALDTITEKDVIAETPADDSAVDDAIDDAIEAAIQTYRQRNTQ